MGEGTQPYGKQALKFYLVTLVGIFSGLEGHASLHGSLFMDRRNSTNVMRGIHCLRCVFEASPHAIYWSYITGYAQQLSLPLVSTEDMLIARLACLMRASTQRDCELLRETWAGLSSCDRAILTQHLIADGITERAFMLAFLPA